MAATLRPWHPPSSLYFSTPHISTPQASKPTTANASPMAHGLRMALGSGGAMIWWRHWSTHGERSKSRWVAAARVGCCVGEQYFAIFLWTYSSFSCDMWRSSLQSHFFGLISTFCMDLFSSIARGTKATGKEFGPCEKVQISPKIRKSLYGVGIGIEIFLTWEQYGKMWNVTILTPFTYPSV